MTPEIEENMWQKRDGSIIQANPEANDIMCVKRPDTPPKTWRVEDFEDDTPVSKPDDSCFEAFDYLLAALGQERYIAGQASIRPMPMFGSFEDAMIGYVYRGRH